MKFDIEKAKQGKSVCNQLGNNVRIICFDRKSCDPIVALHECNGKELLCIHDLNGEVRTATMPHEYVLLMKCEKRKMWVNIYRDLPDSHVRCFGDLKPYATEEEAKNNIGDSKDYIATVPIEWEE